MWLDNGHIPVKQKQQIDAELVVRPSIMMSSFCYSIFRLDPYIGCEHSCAYCYTRFLPSLRLSSVRARADYPKQLYKAIKKLRNADLPLPAFRMSALTDSFQSIEEKLKISLKLMQIAKEFKLSLIISTKSPLLVRSPWLNVVEELAEEGLVVVQFSIALLSDEVAKKLEPGAPPPSERLKVAEKLSDKNIPVVLRLQPLIPYLNTNTEQIERYADIAKAVGARHVIAEVLRIASMRDLELFKYILNEEEYRKLINNSLWEHFPKSSQRHPHKGWRIRVYTLIRDIVAKRGLNFALCREGFFYLNNAPDCCGIYLLKERVLRYTLYEFLHGLKQGYEYLKPNDLERIPLSGIRRELCAHYDYLQRVIRDRVLLANLL